MVLLYNDREHRKCRPRQQKVKHHTVSCGTDLKTILYYYYELFKQHFNPWCQVFISACGSSLKYSSVLTFDKAQGKLGY